MEKKESNSLVYATNLFHLLCWLHIFIGAVLYLICLHHDFFFSPDKILGYLLVILKITQFLQFTDMLFSLLKLTRGSVFSSFLQITGRNYISLFILTPQHSNLTLGLVLLNWSFADFVRYFYYLWPNRVSLFLRYNAFLINYPLGITGELLSVQEKINSLRGNEHIMFYFYRISQIAVFSGFLFLFNYMLSARKGALKKIKEKAG